MSGRLSENPEVQALIRRVARRIRRRPQLRHQGVADIAQDLLVLIIQKERLLRRDRGSDLAFARCVLRTGVRTMIRDAGRQKRDPRRIVPLDDRADPGSDRRRLAAADPLNRVDELDELQRVLATVPDGAAVTVQVRHGLPFLLEHVLPEAGP